MEVKGIPSIGWKSDLYFTPWIISSRSKGHRGRLFISNPTAVESLRIEGTLRSMTLLVLERKILECGLRRNYTWDGTFNKFFSKL